MLIQEWVYLGFVIYGLLSFMWDLAKLSIWIDDKRLEKASKQYDFESRLHNGEILSKENIL
tara:strand:+ start:272 stop:454 length:183 start_codon:yes stop_codon:yes gene_type:complete